MNIVFAAHSSFHDNFVVGSHHLARGMAAQGHNVWHIGPPVTPFHFAHYHRASPRRRLQRALRPPEMRDGLMMMEPFSLVPWQIARKFGRRGNLFVTWSNLAGRLRQTFQPGEIDLLIIDDPRFAGLEKQLRPRAMLYRPTDFYSEMKGDPTIIEAERRVLAGCAAVVSTSQPVLEHALTLRPGLPSLLLENGVEHGHFSMPAVEPESLRDIPHPRIVYVGALDFRFDHELVFRLAIRFPTMHFVLIGGGRSVPAIEALRTPNIHWLGSRSYRDVPGYLQHSDLGILPLTDNRANAGRSPMKLYEYGAAGLRVLARRTHELARRRESFVELYSNEEEAARALTDMLGAAVDRAAIARQCETHAWTRKTVTLLQFVADWCKPALVA